jgi:polar amino acid transport system substrate-binding protein
MDCCRNSVVLLAISFVLIGTGTVARAQAPTHKKLIVGTKQEPPFAIKQADGTWAGISVELWRGIAADLNVTYEWRELSLQELLNGVRDGSLDLAVATLTVTAEREKYIDFTHPFYSTGLSIAVNSRTEGFLRFVRPFLSWRFLHMFAFLAVVLFVVAVLVWLFERKRNPEQFDKDAIKGIGEGFWWAVVTMTSVGYGDRVPTTIGGRVLAITWMFAGIIMISLFIAAITTTLTVSHLRSEVLGGPDDLARLRVATVPGSTSEAYLRRNNISYRNYPALLEALRAVANGEIDAVVYDAPLLRYLAKTQLQGRVDVLPFTFDRQDYAIALPFGSPLRQPMNRLILQKVHEPAWQSILDRYLGKDRF